jgi:malate dehydrogenase (oxaloacetate-decarboxylating)
MNDVSTLDTQLKTGDTQLKTGLIGYDLINTPLLNKGTACTEAERDVFRVHGLLPRHIGTLDEQAAR